MSLQNQRNKERILAFWQDMDAAAGVQFVLLMPGDAG